MEPLITDNNSAPLVVDDSKENRGQGDQLDIVSKKGYRVGRSRIRKIRSRSPTESVASSGSAHKLRSRIPYNRLHSVPRKYIPSNLLDSQIRADVKDAFNEDVVVPTPNGKSISDTAQASNGETLAGGVTDPPPNGETLAGSVTDPPPNGETISDTPSPPNGETMSDTNPPSSEKTISDNDPPISESDSATHLIEETPSGSVTAPPPKGKTISESDTAPLLNEETPSGGDTVPPPNGNPISESDNAPPLNEKTISKSDSAPPLDSKTISDCKSKVLEFADRFLTRMSSSIFATLGIFLMFFVIWMYDFSEPFLTTQEAVGDLFTHRSRSK